MFVVVVVEMMGLLEWVWCRFDGGVDVGDVALFKQKREQDSGSDDALGQGSDWSDWSTGTSSRCKAEIFHIRCLATALLRVSFIRVFYEDHTI